MPDIGSLLALLGLRNAGQDIELPNERGRVDPRIIEQSPETVQEHLRQALGGYKTLTGVSDKYNTLNQPPQRK